MTDNRDRLSRRRFVEATSVATMLGLAGCSGNGGGDGGGGDGGGGDGGDGGGGGGGTPTRNGDPLDVLHGWNGGDGATAAEHLVSTFKDQYPDMNTNFETIGGGGNQNLDAVVA
ncbi:MAG: carbohydrate ABC transporter substrate-binding protein, partial [Haloarculaceae archaeon]